MIERELPFVRDMFDRIAPRYDFLNRLLSLRRDVFWRRALVASLQLTAGTRVLDAACGTADVGLEIVRQMESEVTVTGIDFSPQMLRLARMKTLGGSGICLAVADAFDLPFKAAGFDAITMAFGIRNIQNKLAVLNRFYEQLKPGGRLAILELATPSSMALRRAYMFYFNRLLPAIGRLFSQHHYAYSYLPASVAQFPPAGRFCALMRQAGFIDVRYREMSLGIVVLFVGDKPLNSD